jgi:uncharacterized coiled-coil DUF342 family protein
MNICFISRSWTLILFVIIISFVANSCGTPESSVEKEEREKREMEEEKLRIESNKEVKTFVEQFAPEIIKKISEIQKEIDNANLNVKKLNALAEKFPDQKNLINESIKTWKEIQNTLKTTYADIENNLRASYVAYKIDEIKGRKSFDKIKSQLLEKATQSLDSAKHLRSTIQEVSAK